MSARLLIDGLDFARNAEALHGKITVAELERLQDYLSDNRGELEYTVSGGLDGNGKPVLRIAIKGALNLRCQRCLGGLAHPVRVQTSLLLAGNENELARLDENELVDGVLAEPEMDVLALIEDEMILSLPISPRHRVGMGAEDERGECSIGK